MSRSLRLLSWNTQMRSWAMEVGMPPTIPQVTTAEERAELIADGVVSNSFDYDIVCLCKAFDEDSRDILRSRLRARFPWIVTKCDFGFAAPSSALRHSSICRYRNVVRQQPRI